MESRKERIKKKYRMKNIKLLLLSISLCFLFLLYGITTIVSDSYSYFTSQVIITGQILTQEDFGLGKIEIEPTGDCQDSANGNSTYSGGELGKRCDEEGEMNEEERTNAGEEVFTEIDTIDHSEKK